MQCTSSSSLTTPFILSVPYGEAVLGQDSDANYLFLTFLFSNKEVGVQFLKDVGLFQARWGVTFMVIIRPDALTLIVWTVLDGDMQEDGTFHVLHICIVGVYGLQSVQCGQLWNLYMPKNVYNNIYAKAFNVIVLSCGQQRSGSSYTTMHGHIQHFPSTVST
jgi:hypothetical protein